MTKEIFYAKRIRPSCFHVGDILLSDFSKKQNLVMYCLCFFFYLNYGTRAFSVIPWHLAFGQGYNPIANIRFVRPMYKLDLLALQLTVQWCNYRYSNTHRRIKRKEFRKKIYNFKNEINNLDVHRSASS
jgi:hypothetical protein